MASVTVPGPGGTSITQTFGNSFNQQLAQSISNALAAVGASNLNIVTAGAGLAPTNASGKIGELVIPAGFTGSVTVPASANWTYVIDNSNGPDTIFGNAGLSIMAGGGNHTIVDPTVVVLGDTSSGSTNNITITGSGDNVAVGNGTNTLTGTGSGTMSGGTGTNTFVEQGSYIVNSQGVSDTVVGGSGATTVNASGANASVKGGGGQVTGNLSGTGDTLIGAGGAVAVTVSGNTSDVVAGSGGFTAMVTGASDTVVGGSGAGSINLTGSNALVTGGLGVLTVQDTGTGDTINAGAGITSVSTSNGSFVRAGAGALTFVGGAGGSTIFGSGAGATIGGSTGNTLLAGANGGAYTYVDTTTGSLTFGAGAGSETVDASLSKGSNTLYGSGSDSTGHLVMQGGVTNNMFVAGRGAETLVGGAGTNTFEFFTANGGASAVNTIPNFSAIDLVLLGGYGAGAAAAAIAGAVTANGSTTITLSDNTKITFTGVTSGAALTGHIFSS